MANDVYQQEELKWLKKLKKVERLERLGMPQIVRMGDN